MSQRPSRVENLQKYVFFGKVRTSNQNIVMNEEFVQNSVMNAQIDQKVAVVLSMFTSGG